MFTYRCHVRTSWLDYNGHMNVRPYIETFFDAADLAVRDLDLGASYSAGGHTLFTGDFHITYVAEVLAGGTLTIVTRVLDVDSKRFLLHQEMINDRSGGLAATAEHLQLNVGVESRRVEHFSEKTLRLLRDAQQCGEGSPRNIGRAAILAAGPPSR